MYKLSPTAEVHIYNNIAPATPAVCKPTDHSCLVLNLVVQNINNQCRHDAVSRNTASNAAVISNFIACSLQSLERIQGNIRGLVRAVDASSVANLYSVVAVCKMVRQRPSLFRCNPHSQQVPFPVFFLHSRLLSNLMPMYAG